MPPATPRASPMAAASPACRGCRCRAASPTPAFPSARCSRRPGSTRPRCCARGGVAAHHRLAPATAAARVIAGATAGGRARHRRHTCRANQNRGLQMNIRRVLLASSFGAGRGPLPGLSRAATPDLDAAKAVVAAHSVLPTFTPPGEPFDARKLHGGEEDPDHPGLERQPVHQEYRHRDDGRRPSRSASR